MKLKIKIGIDFLMTALLLLLMVYQVVGETLHEWFGAAMLVLFLVHNILNIKWYKNLVRGKYKSVRILGTVLNFAVLATILSLAYSGIVMSRHVFAFLPIDRGMALARVMHNVLAILLRLTSFNLANSLRAAGDVRFTMAVGSGSILLFRLESAMLFGVVLHLGVIGVWMAIGMDWPARFLSFTLRYKGEKWKQ